MTLHDIVGDSYLSHSTLHQRMVTESLKLANLFALSGAEVAVESSTSLFIVNLVPTTHPTLEQVLTTVASIYRNHRLQGDQNIGYFATVYPWCNVLLTPLDLYITLYSPVMPTLYPELDKLIATFGFKKTSTRDLPNCRLYVASVTNKQAKALTQQVHQLCPLVLYTHPQDHTSKNFRGNTIISEATFFAYKDVILSLDMLPSEFSIKGQRIVYLNLFPGTQVSE